ncbi:hypothetical protein PQ465_08755 [Sphingobacterium oryzagri]|uniref:Uncharacterized protein n=1 Tax=Sphingobacterium oryzagri TaxID=3025669 RepID=A0ABY7WPW0_9SPHI|nr:hypothetical protein [Sphingobacterium sp. KACC 22765]WDF70451.1 hypothetical protein PQ465_08755 [Sphingobacterium sp. KACC 22765]
MTNISCINNDHIRLDKDLEYFVIDALYLAEIKEHIDNLKNLGQHEMIEKIRNDIFPYTDLPYALVNGLDREWNVERIEKINYSDDLVNDNNAFAVDTGLIIFLNVNILLEFAEKFDFDLLVDHPINDVNIEYWKNITTPFKIEDVALVCSSQSENGLVFDGGTYRIRKTC